MDTESIEIILVIIIVFLASLLGLSMMQGAVTLFMVIGALACTYLFVHYWEKHFLSKKYKNEIKHKEKG